MHIVFEIKSWPVFTSDSFELRNYLFGSVKLTKNADLNKCSYSRYGISFDVRGTSSLSNSKGFGKNVIIFGADMTSCVHIDNRKKRYFNTW